MDEIRTNDKEDTKIMDAMMNNFTQPILYLQKAPNADIINEIIKNQQMLHTAPLEASKCINTFLAKKFIEEGKETPDLLSDVSTVYNLDYNQTQIALDEFIMYSIHNTIIGFCTMLDYTGPIFKSIIDYIPIKKYVSDDLLGDTTSIKRILNNFIFSRGKSSFSYIFNTINPISEVDISNTYNLGELFANQLSQALYTKICGACDRAITEVLLGTRTSPNKQYIYDSCCKYFGIKDKGISTVHEAYYKLNTTLVNMIDKLMAVVVTPMCKRIFMGDTFLNMYYVFDMFGFGRRTEEVIMNQPVIEYDEE